MKKLFKILAILSLINLISLLVKADNISINSPNILANQWEDFPQGIALALVLIHKDDNGHAKYVIKLHIKNTSKADKFFSEMEDISRLEFYYINASNRRIPFHNYSYNSNGDNFTFNIPPNAIKPGEVLTRTVAITPEEATLAGHYPVMCSFLISDQETSKAYKIESAPKILTETVIPAPNKEH